MVRLLVGILACAGMGSSARADWLVELAPDALPAQVGSRHASTPTTLVYPRPGLPALVEPGETIVARVIVPAPLMPAPGIQQPRALRGWSAELVGHSVALDEGAEHRYSLRVLDVRADASSGLVFRATVRVPPWAAPGTYSFRIDSPGSEVALASGSVRVLVPDRAPIVARWADHDEHATWDVDVWLSDESLPAPLSGAGVPWLDTRIDARFSFSADLTPTEPSERAMSYVFLETAERVRIEDAQWFLATDVRPIGVRASILARLGAAPAVRREGSCSGLEVEGPESAQVDEPFIVRGHARAVAWAFEEDGACYSLAAAEDSAWAEVGLRWIGVQELHALAIEDGCARRGQVAVRVEPALRMGCSAAGHSSGFLWFLGLLCTIFRRR